MKSVKDYLLLYLKGVAMGSADVVPGVSGGTIAFITGIYETLLQSIRSVDLQALGYLKKFNLKAFWNHIGFDHP
jgi:putative membrane protein